MLRIMLRSVAVVAALGSIGACGDEAAKAASPDAAPAAAHEPAEVGYDIRIVRPRNEESLADMFERVRKQAVADGKEVAVLFSASWCEPCRMLELELGGLHPATDIGHVRIVEIKEEDWDRATRMNEVHALRARWGPADDSYPLFVALDEDGEKVEEMKEAKARLEAAGQDATLPVWFRGLRSG